MRRRTCVGALLGGCALLGLLFGIVGATFLVVRGLRTIRTSANMKRLAATLPDERLSAQREGVLLGPDDLTPETPLPERQNAAPIYEEITRRLKQRPLSKTAPDLLSKIVRGTVTAGERREALALLATYAPELRAAERAAALPNCRFRRDWLLGPALPFPEFAAARQIARMLAARAVLQNQAGHPKAALRSVATIAHISRHMGTDPTLIAMLVQISLQAIGDRAWHRIVETNCDKTPVLDLASQVDGDFGPLPDLSHAMRSEVVLARFVLDDLRQGKDTASVLDSTSLTSEGRNTIVDACEAHYLSSWRRICQAVDRSRKRDSMEVYRDLKSISDAEKSEVTPDEPTHKMTAELVSIYPETDLKLVGCEALRRLRPTTIVIFRYRLRTGRFPQTLKDIGPAAPLDPFTNRPLCYRTTSGGFVLYSVGANLKDDGGDVEVHGKDQPLDIGIAYPTT